MSRLFIAFLTICFFSCTSKKENTLLNIKNLESQFISVNPNIDTIIKTGKGALLKIARGTFNKPVKLEVKEAYSMQDMILAGLTTESDGNTLSSGGMIYLNTVENIEPSKPIGVSIPTDFIDENMKLYKGEEEDGEINWTDPEPLPKNSISDAIDFGKTLFEQSCKSCHTIFATSPTAPAMAGYKERGAWADKQTLYRFTRNPPAYKDCYVDNLKKEYGYIMTPFPNLSDKDLDALYVYIDNETKKSGMPASVNEYDNCLDSCKQYDSLLYAFDQIIYQRDTFLAKNREERVEWNIQNPQLNWNSRNRTPGVEEENNKVVINSYQALYYTFDIEGMGWYNIDQMIEMNKNLKESLLKVNVEDKNGNGVNTYLVIPSLKVFAPGGKIKGQEAQYGFHENDGRIPLPLGTDAYVFAISEADDKVLFDFKKFTITQDQAIDLDLKPMSKEDFQLIVRNWNFEGFTISTADSKIREEIKKSDNDIKQLETSIKNYKPKNCDCDCIDPYTKDSNTTPGADTTNYQ